MHHPASKIMNFLSEVVTTLCTAICLQAGTNKTRGSRVALCSPGQERHTVAVLKDPRRLFDTRRQDGVWCDDTSQPPVSLSLFVLVSLGVSFPSSVFVQAAPLICGSQKLCFKGCHGDRKTGRWWTKGGGGERLGLTCCWWWMWRRGGESQLHTSSNSHVF